MYNETMEKETFEQYLQTIKEIAAKEGFEELDPIFTEHLRCRFYGQEVIIGEKMGIYLREIKMEDLEAFCAFTDAGREPVLDSFLKRSRKESEEYLRDYISHMYELYDYGLWTVVERQTKEILGICGIGQFTDAGKTYPDLGYYIKPERRGQGFAKKSIEIVLNYAKNYLDFPAIYVIIKKENRISIKLAEKFGFVQMREIENQAETAAIYEKKLT